MKQILKMIIVAFGVLVMALMGLLLWQYRLAEENQAPAVSDYKNLSYTIENQKITLVNGYSEMPAAPGSASKIITKYFGNEAVGDLNGDGTQDTVFLLTQETGGSGTFYYVAAALKTDAGYQPTNTILLGDRIAPQTTEVSGSIITVNYTDRKPGEAMSVIPSVGVSKYFKIENGKLAGYIAPAVVGAPITLQIGQQAKLTDGLIILLKEINDSGCKQGVVCIWAGELSPLLNINGQSAPSAVQEVRLGTTTATKVTKNGYIFELKGATQTTATITVTLQNKPVACTMEAKLCPDGSYVARTGPNCEFAQCPATSQGPCYVGGCSSEICSDQKDMASSCIYKPEFACYKTATCARQNGQCGWTQTAALTECLLHSR